MNYIQINTSEQAAHKLGQIILKWQKWISKYLAKFQIETFPLSNKISHSELKLNTNC